jgi:hypothetical protein
MLITMPISGKIHGTAQALPTPTLPLADRLVRGADVRQIILSPKDIERFWSKVDRSGGPDVCWPWMAGRAHFGHGRFVIGQRSLVSHRVSWAIANGKDPGELCVLHECDNPPCCNPAHLVRGTRDDNVRHRGVRKRQARGEGIPLAKLTERQVQDIRLAAASRTHRSLAREYGVHHATIDSLVSRRTWKHVA